jgi:hypothetical protein
MLGDEILRAEQEKIKRLIALGLGRYDAVQAVDSGLELPAEPVHQEPVSRPNRWRRTTRGLAPGIVHRDSRVAPESGAPDMPRARELARSAAQRLKELEPRIVFVPTELNFGRVDALRLVDKVISVM